MNIFGSAAAEGRSARRGVMLLFGFTGFLLVKGWSEYERDHLRLVLGIANLVIFIGLWLNWRWARWLALGACFLAVVAAFAMPVILELWQPFRNYQGGATPAALFTCATAAAFGMIGYKGLGYLRSPAAWEAFSSDAKQRDALARESSSMVVISAGCIAVFLGMVAIARGVQGPDFPSMARTPGQLPDLYVNSLCMSGQNLVKAEVKNLGTGTDAGRFKIAFSDLRDFGRGDRGGSWGEVPAPGQSNYVALDNAINQSEQDGVRQLVHLVIDSYNSILESEENNNTADFTIVYHSFNPGNLPNCP